MAGGRWDVWRSVPGILKLAGRALPLLCIVEERLTDTSSPE